MSNQKVFPDGSSLTWVDRETLRYSEGEHEAQIWVDYAPGLFSRGRELRRSSLERWSRHPENTASEISPEKRAEIEQKVATYYGKRQLTIK